MIELKNLSHTYSKNVKAVKDLNLKIEDSEICVLIGPSGCGKSTTLNMINKLIDITSGDIIIDGKNISEIESVQLRRSIGYVIQDNSLFPHKTVGQNVATVPMLKKWEKEKTNKRVNNLLKLMGLDPNRYIDKYPIQLSGGEKQRVGVARALGVNPPILLMDEPFGEVDPITRERLQDEFLSIQEKIKKTIVFVTHDIDEAIKMGDTIAIMNNGELIQHDTPKNILQNPKNGFVRDFMGKNIHIKRLQLISSSEILEDTTYGLKSDSLETITEKINKIKINSLPIIDDNKKLLGFVSKKHLENNLKDWSENIEKYDSVINEKTTVYEAVFDIMVDINSYLPVTNEKGEFSGVITQIKVNEILTEIKEEGR